MERRLKLQRELSEVGNCKCYFDPPESIKLQYPCIIYSRMNGEAKYANDSIYGYMKSYSITVIDRDPDSEISDRLLEHFKYIMFERWYSYDELGHWSLRLYY